MLDWNRDFLNRGTKRRWEVKEKDLHPPTESIANDFLPILNDVIEQALRRGAEIALEKSLDSEEKIKGYDFMPHARDIG